MKGFDKPVKKIVSLLIVMGLIFSMSACGQKNEPTTTGSEPEQMEFTELQWPDTEIAKLMPIPKSTTGNINWSQDYGFVIYVAETSMDDYAAYVQECETLGFTSECQKGDDYFYADNADGYHVALNYQEGDIMFVRIDEPKDEPYEPVTVPPVEGSSEPIEPPTEQPVEAPAETLDPPVPLPEESDPVDTTVPPEESDIPKDDYSDSAHRSQAKQAFQNYGDYLCPYGIEYHWFHSNVSEYEGNGVWHFKVGVTITNEYDANRDAVAEGRVSFIEEDVTEFKLLDDWD